MTTPQHSVRFINYQAQFQKMEREIMDTIHETLKNGDVMLRHQLSQFESDLAEFVGTKAGIGVNSCTDGMFLTLKAMGIGAGDEVITVSHTFIATAAAIHHTGATPVFVDVGPDHAMDPAKIEEAITPQTKAIVPVHLNGYVCQMDRICEIAERNGLFILEDSAQALGASYRGKRGGSWGLAACYSFYPAKQLGTFGDGGGITTSDEELAEKLKQMRNHGRLPDGDVLGYCYNSRLDNLHAAILSLKLKKLPEWIEERRVIAQKYFDALSDINELNLPVPPNAEEDHFCGYQNYEFEAQDRDGLLQHLRDNGIEIILPWGGKAIHQFKGLKLEHYREKLPVTERLFEHVMTIPMHNELSSQDTDYVVEQVRAYYGK